MASTSSDQSRVPFMVGTGDAPNGGRSFVDWSAQTKRHSQRHGFADRPKERGARCSAARLARANDTTRGNLEGVCRGASEHPSSLRPRANTPRGRRSLWNGCASAVKHHGGNATSVGPPGWRCARPLRRGPQGDENKATLRRPSAAV
eukprot:136667-Prorocentrum_minimum.AAC.2